ncbi:putative HTH-type transcriptional regulator [Mycobacteroides salmoniphilum]|uniref:Putative HTH-type transcriptional regulator n=1 Tax=Mycobacteroides salmoniphilum TaxID=404941 RepID=A0A4R8T0L8_9MYCO|nr:putative HTH-type transcriptional regulator [Mycobacteroides salmoniphilum]
MVNSYPGSRLRGRAPECASLGRLIAAARSGPSQILVLRGEAGIGKTALLGHAIEEAHGFRVVRTAGVESEMELAFAGLQHFCGPLSSHLEALPSPQREALDIAFGIRSGPVPDRFLIGLAVLSLLAAAAEHQPVLCVVDDAQWLDRVSLQTLAFATRRLASEPVAALFAVRGGSDDELTGLPELTVGGLRAADAGALLDSAIPGLLDDRVRDRIVAETHGNPLALLELPRDLTTEELAGGFGWPDGGRLTGHIEQAFLRRVRQLPVETQTLLLTAATDPLGDAALLARASDRLGISMDALAPAEGADLIELGTRVRFRHPLVRSAIYRSAEPLERRRIHGALAEATDPVTDPDRRAWHRAHAAAGTNEAIAAELEQSADRAQARGGILAAAAFLQRATELTSDPAQRGLRALAAAQSKHDAAAYDAARELLAIADMAPLDPLARARAARLRAKIAFAESRVGTDGSTTVSSAAIGLLEAAKDLENLDDDLARETYLDAVGAAMYGGRLCPRGGAVEVAEPARLAPAGSQPPRPTDLLLDGLAMRITHGAAASAQTLRDALDLIRREADRPGNTSWMWQAFPIALESATHEVWDDQMWHHLATRAVQIARDIGALSVLPSALIYRAGVHVHAGELDAAAELVQEADAISAATGHAPIRYHSLILAAWRGTEPEAIPLIDAAMRDGAARGEGRLLGAMGYAAGVLNNGLGRYELAFHAARRACEHEDLGLYSWCLTELIEAAVRCGEHDTATKALDQLEERAGASDSDWATGMVARSRALLAVDDDAEACYREAIERLSSTKISVHLARAHLIYGEWLRRCHRRADARTELAVAHDSFAGMGAEAFAGRAQRELLATGAKVRKRSASSSGASAQTLTAQEAQIARMAGQGLTNQEIAAQLFISSHTVEWHLRKVFAKRGITSRRQLRSGV